MRILWFINLPVPRNLDALNSSGGWLFTLMEELRPLPDVEVAAAFCVNKNCDSNFELDGLRCYEIGTGCPQRLFFTRNPDIGNRERLDSCVKAVRDFKPDLIHVHGTEKFFALLGARKLVDVPLLTTIQGIMRPCSTWHGTFGDYSRFDILTHQPILQFVRGGGSWWDYQRFKKKALQEDEIFRGNRYFAGRTQWDHDYMLSMNPDAVYFNIGELLRQPFYNNQWTLDQARKHSIIFTNFMGERRGTQILLQAVALLKPEFPDIRITLAGGSRLTDCSGRLVKAEVRRLGLQDQIVLPGRLNAEQMTETLLGSHVFALASYIENSPNSLCEAQMLGMPTVASAVGGVPSLVDDGKTGLLFPAGDAAALAERLRRIFTDDEFARELGCNAAASARKRHDRKTVINQLMSAYEKVAETHLSAGR